MSFIQKCVLSSLQLKSPRGSTCACVPFVNIKIFCPKRTGRGGGTKCKILVCGRKNNPPWPRASLFFIILCSNHFYNRKKTNIVLIKPEKLSKTPSKTPTEIGLKIGCPLPYHFNGGFFHSTDIILKKPFNAICYLTTKYMKVPLKNIPK